MDFNFSKMCIKYILKAYNIPKQSLVIDILGMFISCGGEALSLILLVGEGLRMRIHTRLESVVSN